MKKTILYISLLTFSAISCKKEPTPILPKSQWTFDGTLYKGFAKIYANDFSASEKLEYGFPSGYYIAIRFFYLPSKSGIFKVKKDLADSTQCAIIVGLVGLDGIMLTILQLIQLRKLVLSFLLLENSVLLFLMLFCQIIMNPKLRQLVGCWKNNEFNIHTAAKLTESRIAAQGNRGAQACLRFLLLKQLLQSKCATQGTENRIPPVDNIKNFKFAHVHLPAYLCTWQQEILPLTAIPLNFLVTVLRSMTFY